MSDPKVLIEGDAKFRDNRKWRSRWCVLTKLSPAADCVHLQMYKDSKVRCKKGPTKASLSLEKIVAIESDFTLDKESNTLAIICAGLVVVLAFDSRETLIQWQVKIGYHVPEEEQFLVQITHLPNKSKLSCGPARLHIQDWSFALITGLPPKLSGTWQISDLRRYGVVDGKFCFEGGSACGKEGEGLHVLHTNRTEQVEQAFLQASLGELSVKKRIKRNNLSSIQKSNIKHPESDSGLPDRSLSHSDSGSGSGCEACPQLIGRGIACCAGHDIDLDSCLSDENYATRTTCSTLKWSSSHSCSSNSGLSAVTIDPSYIAAQSLHSCSGHTNRSEDVQSLHSVTCGASGIGGGSGSGSVVHENRSSPAPRVSANAIAVAPSTSTSNISTNDVHLVWSLAKCNRCNGNGRDYCTDRIVSNNPAREVRCSTLDRIDTVKQKVIASSENPSINSNVIVNPIPELALKSSSGLILLIQGWNNGNAQSSSLHGCLLDLNNCPHGRIKNLNPQLNHHYHSHTHLHLHKNCCNGTNHFDRTSLCSSSSRSSGGSTGSSSGAKFQNNPEYSTLRVAEDDKNTNNNNNNGTNIDLESWYDVPKKFHHHQPLQHQQHQQSTSPLIVMVNDDEKATCNCTVTPPQNTGNAGVNELSKPVKTIENSNYVNCDFINSVKTIHETMDVKDYIASGHYQVPRTILANIASQNHIGQ